VLAELASTSLAEAARRFQPEVALVLGSGMSRLAGHVDIVHQIAFREVPGLAIPTVENHRGVVTLGTWAERRVLVFEGRLHFYEGHPWRRVEMPAQIAAELGARILFLTNAAGGIRADLQPGCLMAIRDHIEWTRPYCWRLPGPGGIGVARATHYSARLLERLKQASAECRVPISEGIYAAVTGPNYETPAEIRALRTWGADAVGMSTAREAARCVELGMECLALSCITNLAAGLSQGPIHHAEVLTTAAAQSANLAKLITAWLRVLSA
jgi:purine-nucleoside phosphorylase